MKRLSFKLSILGVLGMLLTFSMVQLRSGKAQSYCAASVYEYCWSQGRPVDPSTCECDWFSCLGLPESDCTENSQYLDYSTCTCVSNPSAVGYCDLDPYAYGCPRSFDTVFGNQLRVRQSCQHPDAWMDPSCNPMIGGGSDDICSFDSYIWCSQNGGTWSSYGCACSGIIASGQTQQQACTSAGGFWYDSGNGASCYNPDGISDEYQCSSTNETLSTCASSGGRWNPYTCTCSP